MINQVTVLVVILKITNYDNKITKRFFGSYMLKHILENNVNRALRYF